MSEATCKGSYLLGSACGHCSRCALELSAAKESQDLLAQLYAKDAEIAELQAENAKLKEHAAELQRIIDSDGYLLESSRKLEKAKAALRDIQNLVNEQAEDAALWGVSLTDIGKGFIERQKTIGEAHALQELRNLHALIESSLAEITGGGSDGT